MSAGLGRFFMSLLPRHHQKTDNSCPSCPEHDAIFQRLKAEIELGKKQRQSGAGVNVEGREAFLRLAKG